MYKIIAASSYYHVSSRSVVYANCQDAQAELRHSVEETQGLREDARRCLLHLEFRVSSVKWGFLASVFIVFLHTEDTINCVSVCMEDRGKAQSNIRRGP